MLIILPEVVTHTSFMVWMEPRSTLHQGSGHPRTKGYIYICMYIYIYNYIWVLSIINYYNYY